MRSGEVALAAQATPADRMKLWELRNWTLLMIGVTYWANVARSTDPGEAVSLVSVANSVISEGAFNLLAWFVIFENARSKSLDDRASGRQMCLALLISAICIAPSKQATAMAMLTFGIFLYYQSKTEVFTRRIALILMVFAFEIVWTSPYLNFLHVGVGRLDAHAVAAIYNAFGYAIGAHGNVIENTPQQFSVIVIGPCSSSYGLVSICLAFVVTALFRHRDLHRSVLPWLGAACLASVAITELRLILTVESEAKYEWWHNGPGYSIYSVAATALVAFFAIMATRERQPVPGGVN